MYTLELKSSVKKDFNNIDKSDIRFIKDTLMDFAHNFSTAYEQELLKIGKIKKLQGFKEEIYRLKLRRYSTVYLKEDDKLIILVLLVKSREDSYKK